MHKYPIGLEVLIKKPKNLHQGPIWVKQMDYADNKIACIINYSDEDYYIIPIYGEPWTFWEKWLTPATELAKVLYG